jgi:serine/threonine-protein kinase RsbW
MTKKTSVLDKFKEEKRGAKRLRLRCISNPKEITKIEEFLEEVNRVARLDDGTFYRLMVATTEAVNNAILHGNKSDSSKKVCVQCDIVNSSIFVYVKDEGKGFDPSVLPNPTEKENLLRPSGRGIFLMRTLMDDVRFHFTEEGTVVEMLLDYSKLR